MADSRVALAWSIVFAHEHIRSECDVICELYHMYLGKIYVVLDLNCTQGFIEECVYNSYNYLNVVSLIGVRKYPSRKRGIVKVSPYGNIRTSPTK